MSEQTSFTVKGIDIESMMGKSREMPQVTKPRKFGNSLFPGAIGICIDSRKYSLLEKGIELFSGGNAYHVFLIINEKELIEAHMKKGVRRVPIAEYQQGSGVVMIADPSFLEDDERDEVVARALEWEGHKYDMLNIWGKMFKQKWDKSDSVICSELVALAYKPLYRFIGLRPENVTPADILEDVKHSGQWSLEYLIHT